MSYYETTLDRHNRIDAANMTFQRKQNLAMSGLDLADFFDAQMLRLKTPALPPGPLRQPVSDDYETFTPVRLKREADVEDQRTEIEAARQEIGVLGERITYYESLFETVHFVLISAGVPDGDLLTMVTALADGDELAVAS